MNQVVIWCDLNAEHDALEKALGDMAFSIRGSTPDDKKVEYERRWRDGERPFLITKPLCCAWGLNWQNCHNMIFVGMSDSWEMQYQAIRRCYRFGQKEDVNVILITSQSEGAVKENIERKEAQFQTMLAEMVEHTKEILEKEIRGTTRMTNPYNPKTDMIIPKWLRSIK